MDSLDAYRGKRNRGRTPEPMPDPPEPDAPEAEAPEADAPEADAPEADAPEAEAPEAEAPAPTGPAPGEERARVFVVQEQHARRLHWDFRLERDGVLVSWAVPKGVPDDPAVNHFAAHTEDHPLEYAGFAGRIPAGEYGAGAVTIWDRGTFEAVKWTDSEVKVVLHGRRLTGGYTL